MFGIDDMALATGISGIMSGGSSLFGGMMGAAGQQEVNAQQLAFARQSQNIQQDQYWQSRADNLLQAQITRDYSNTAYQRAMADMKAAGLNPILAGSLGGAQSTPGAQIGSASPAGLGSLGNPGASMQQGLQGLANAIGHTAQYKASLAQAGQAESQKDLNKESTELAKANTGLTKEATERTKQDTITGAATEANQRAQAGAAAAQAAVSAANVGLIQQQTNSAASEAKIKAAEAEDVSKFGVPRNEGVAGLIQRIFRNMGPGSVLNPPTSAKGAAPGETPLIQVKPKDWGMWDPRNWNWGAIK